MYNYNASEFNSVIYLTKEILPLLVQKNGKMSPSKTKKYNIPKNLEWCETKSEAIYCLKNNIMNITQKPKCIICGKPIKYDRGTQSYRKFCSKTCNFVIKFPEQPEQTILKKELTKETVTDCLDIKGRVIPNKMKKYFTIPNNLKWCDKPGQVVFHLQNGTSKRPVCKCGKDTYFVDSKVGYLTFCSELCSILNPSGYKSKDYKLPSGKVIKLQGYENKMMDDLLVEYDESEILTDRKDMPKLFYTQDNKTHKYYPDFYIPSTDTIIEVKSEWTDKKNKECGKHFLKMDSVINSGYNFIIKVYR